MDEKKYTYGIHGQQSDFYHACDIGDEEKVKELYNEGGVRADSFAVSIAVRKARVKIVEFLIEKGAKVEYSAWKDTALNGRARNFRLLTEANKEKVELWLEEDVKQVLLDKVSAHYMNTILNFILEFKDQESDFSDLSNDLNCYAYFISTGSKIEPEEIQKLIIDKGFDTKKALRLANNLRAMNAYFEIWNILKGVINHEASNSIQSYLQKNDDNFGAVCQAYIDDVVNFMEYAKNDFSDDKHEFEIGTNLWTISLEEVEELYNKYYYYIDPQAFGEAKSIPEEQIHNIACELLRIHNEFLKMEILK